jgi:hypothetical protein
MLTFDRWSLNTKPMKTVYQGLALRDTLTHFKLRFPSSRVPRPTVLIPGMPRLKSLHISNLDPLCYNDDISLLICEARNLESLYMHFSPRMRIAREPSVYLQNYMGRLAEAPHALKPKELQFFNMFARNDGTLAKCITLDRIESIAFLNCVEHDDPTTVFVDNSWIIDNHDVGLKNLKKLRAEKVDSRFARTLLHLEKLEELYLINGRMFRDYLEKKQQNGQDSSSPSSAGVGTPNHTAKTPITDVGPRVTISDLPEGTTNGASSMANAMEWNRSSNSPISTDSPNSNNPASMLKHVTIASDFIAALTKYQGPRIRKLLLRDSWNLGREVVAHLIANCPNLEQLGIAIDDPSLEKIRWIISSLPKLTALRMLIPMDSEVWRTMSAHSDLHVNMMEMETWKDEYKNLVWLGIGGEIVRLLGREMVMCGDEKRLKGIVKSVGWEDVKDVEIFGLDTLEE